MQCPRCRQDLVRKQYDAIEASVCEACSGMYLEHGELNRLASPTSGDLEFSTVHGDSFEHDDRYGPTACPTCDGSTMKKVEFNIYTNIILDYCSACEGFWLDGPELERINAEVRKLNEAAGDGEEPRMMWFARFIWSLPR